MLTIPLSGQSGKWVKGYGSVRIFNITPEEAKYKALELARADAIQKVVGVAITEGVLRYQTETTLNNSNDYFESFTKFANQNTSGIITQEKISFAGVDNSDNLLSYRVEIDALVESDVGTPDPGFEVDILMEKQVYLFRGNSRDSDPLEFKIWASKDCFIYIFSLSANDSVQLLIPNYYMQNNKYIAGSTEQGYEKDAKKADLKFNVSLTLGVDRAYEALYVVASKHKVDPQSLEKSSLFQNKVTGTLLALSELNQWLVKIPANQRTQNMAKYEIRKFGQ